MVRCDLLPRLLGGLGLMLVLVVLVGCERRTHYRRQADQEVDRIVASSTDDSRYALVGVDVTMDPRSRYFDPNNPDCPPMPSDDPDSHRYMEWVDGKRGYRGWEANGVIEQMENPDWRQRLSEYVPVNSDGNVVLNVDSSLRLAYVHSPTYQNQLETLYLSALDVSAERFRFQTQFYGGDGIVAAHRGDLNPGGERNSVTNTLDARATRRFATAGELLVGFANSFVWQFAGDDTNATVSIVNFNLVQPLLRSGGRVVALEQLTIVERSLLANLRAFQRYRQGLYTQVAVGQLGVSGPQRRGGFFGGTGLTGFTGQGAGGLGGVGGATGFGRFGGGNTIGTAGGAGGLAGGGAGNVGGFIGLLQTLQEFRNAQDSLELQKRSLAQLELSLLGGEIDLTQVDQFRQSIETQRAQLLQAENSLENSIENYLTGTLGLPPDLGVTLDDSFIRPFQLVTPEITMIQGQFNAIQDRLGSLPETTDLASLQPILDDLDTARLTLQEYVAGVEADVNRMEEVSALREQWMTPAEREAHRLELEQAAESFAEVVDQMLTAAPRLAAIKSGLNADTVEATRGDALVWLKDYQVLVEQVALGHARIRLECVTLDALQVDPLTALAVARANRVDLMNNRANLVDAWRLIAFNANALLSDLDVTVSGDLSTIGDNPAKFRGPTANARMGLEFDGPFTRLLERNNYRQSLIDYQQSRRQYIQFEDSLNTTVRQTLRQLEQLQVNLEIQRRAVGIALRRVDFTQRELSKPAAVREPGAPPENRPTLVQNLLSAMSDLRNTQNNFMSVWLNYYATRMILMRELGIMELDNEGRWIDAPVEWSLYMPTEAIEIPPDVPREWMEQAFPEGVPVLEEPSEDVPAIERIDAEPGARLVRPERVSRR